ncbi:host attachment protein [Rhizobium tubonense]|uniref:baeRF12 domain-containing protein n=1 Tax=Rhizobium tubonense TaxID=484088 RepID=UPI001FCEFFB6|nr:host attachment protein [Rhizobium tubonense]
MRKAPERWRRCERQADGTAPAEIDSSKISSGARHSSSSANPDDSQQDDDGFGSGVTDMLNKQVLDGKIKSLVIVAAPRTLGEMRKGYRTI